MNWTYEDHSRAAAITVCVFIGLATFHIPACSYGALNLSLVIPHLRGCYKVIEFTVTA
jgi:hypothetical protein